MITQERLKEILHYNPKTGIFTQKKKTSQRVKIGDPVGCVTQGRLAIRIDDVLYLAHRLAFLYMEGYFPERVVDHINGNPLDNRWKNLRHVGQRCNVQNARIRVDNTSGFKGVIWAKRERLWHARICINGKHRSIGYYRDKLEAALARLTAEDCLDEWKCDEQNENRKKIMKLLGKRGRHGK